MPFHIIDNMAKLDTIHQFEKAIVAILNLDGWNLKWSGAKYEHYDAKGYTAKGFPVVIEMKFRNDYYENKLLEKYKYDKLMEMDEDIVKIYFVNDPNGNYFFWLNKLDVGEPKDFASISLTPATSSTCLAAPPAITPVPGAAGFRRTLEDPCFPIME